MINFQPYYSSSAGNLYTAGSGNSTLMIEAGVTIKQIRAALNYQLSGIRAALVTHAHMDHAKGAAAVMAAGIDCYMTAETARALDLAGHRLHIVEPLQQFTIDHFQVIAFPTEHDCPGSVGWLLTDGDDKLVFATDTYFCRYKFKDVSIFAIECNYSIDTLSPDLHPSQKKRLFKSHFSLENVREFFKANDLSRVREIYLLHLSRDNSDENLFQTEIERLTGKPVYVCKEK